MTMPGFGTVKRDRVGKMRHRALLQYKKFADDPADQYNNRGRSQFTWTNVFDEHVPISIKQLYGRESEQARQLVANATHRVTMRYLAGVKRDMRLKMGDRILYIGDVDNLEESNRYLVLLCEERVE